MAKNSSSTTLMRTQSAATKLLDHIDGWQKVYTDDIATIHAHKLEAAHTAEPAVSPGWQSKTQAAFRRLDSDSIGESI
jgi:hypothetical protein